MGNTEIAAFFARFGTARIALEDIERFRAAEASVAAALALFPKDLSWADEPVHCFRVASTPL